MFKIVKLFLVNILDSSLVLFLVFELLWNYGIGIEYLVIDCLKFCVGYELWISVIFDDKWNMMVLINNVCLFGLGVGYCFDVDIDLDLFIGFL